MKASKPQASKVANRHKSLILELVKEGQPSELERAALKCLRWLHQSRHRKFSVSLVPVVNKAINKLMVYPETALSLIAAEVELLLLLGSEANAVKALTSASMLFSQYGAWQAAYRALGDAECIARRAGLTEELSDIVHSIAVVASDEGDKAFAEEHFREAILLRERANLKVPPPFFLNHATILMHLERYSEAQAVYTRIASGKLHKKLLFSLHVNLAVCKRITESPEASIHELRRATTVLHLVTDREQLIQYHLVAVTTYLQASLLKDACDHLGKAVDTIDEMVSKTPRLHYRRSIREAHVRRFRFFMYSFSKHGYRTGALRCAAFLAQTMTMDWARYLNWIDERLQDSRLSKQQQERTIKVIKEVAGFGAPFAFGFREKYDDPFEEVPASANHALPWNSLKRQLDSIGARLGEAPPYARKYETVNDLEKKITNGTLLLVSTLTKEGLTLSAFFQGGFRSTIVAFEPISKFYQQHAGWLTNSVSRTEFESCLENAADALTACMAEIVKVCRNDSITSVSMVGDTLSSRLPLTVPFLRDDQTRLRMLKGTLKLSQCPICVPGVPQSSTHPARSIRVLVEPAVGLSLANEELSFICRAFNPQKVQVVDVKSDEPFGSSSEADVLHYIGHARALTLSAEPFRASLAEEGVLFNEIQERAPFNSHRLAFLNACHAAATANGNYFRSFLTSEHVSFPTLFLLNRKSHSVAPLWAVADLFAFVFSVWFYRQLAKCGTVEAAFSFAAATTYNATVTEIQKTLEEVQDDKLREEKVTLLLKSGGSHPFRRTYCYGAYRLHSLL
jgi:hypothetical protein